MNKIAIRYAIIQFMPYIETREFANIGIVAACPKLGLFDFRIEHRYARLTNFFPNLEGRLYREAIKIFNFELQRIKDVFCNDKIAPDLARNIFDSLVRPKETIIRLSPASAALTNNFENEVNNLFNYYVQHSFIKGQKEEVLTKRITAFVKNLKNLKSQFVLDKKIGDTLYHVNFPLAQLEDDGNLIKAIKPIYLGQDDSSDMLNKWDVWTTKIERLEKQGFVRNKNQILFTYETTEEPTNTQLKAIEQILKESNQLNMLMVKDNDFEKIESFAVN